MKINSPIYSKNLLYGLILFLGFTFNAYSQEDTYVIRVQNDNISLKENIDTFQWKQLDKSLKIDNGYYTWVQFYETPTQSSQNDIKSKGIELIDYMGSRTYLAYVPSTISQSYLQNIGVRSIETVQEDYKLSEKLRSGIIEDWAVKGENILVTLQFHDRVDSDFVIKDLSSKGISVEEEYIGYSIISLAIPNNCLQDLSSLPYIRYVDLIPSPPVKEDLRGRVLHRSAGLDTQIDAGRNYTGKGIGVLVRDDGFVGPHVDFKGRIDNSNTPTTGMTHGDGVAGVMAGAGNINPDNRGMAAGANVYVANYDPFFLDGVTNNFISTGRVQITNSSYSDSCNDGYNIRAQIVDSQAEARPSLFHVFSGGNSNGMNCGYGAGSLWGNITGGHKLGKNVIAVANVFSNGVLVSTSSRGPSTDGRIKPDISAYGQGQISVDENNEYRVFGGTSAAAPGIAGISAQLYELYRDFNDGEFPEAALIKAAMLNTANEAGNKGPDFRYGWGIVNGLRAGKLLEDERYLLDEITQGVTNTHTISVPEGTTQVRFMLYWPDVTATSGATKALINDLDLVVTNPSSTESLPWILDSSPNVASLNRPATTGVDHLNNMEQVLIDTPEAGDYTISVSGFDIPLGPQRYFVLHEVIKDQITVTHPNEGEFLTPGSEEVIHWDAINVSDSFTLEYSTDGGETYSEITTVDSDEGLYEWTVPSDITGQGKVRVSSGSISDESDGVFAIASRVTGLDLDSVCLAEASFSWNPVADATSYDLYILGDQFMEVVGTSTTNSITVPILDPGAEMWYAITASNEEEGWTSKRTIASFYEGGLLDCVVNNELELTQVLSDFNDFSVVCGDPSGEVSVTIRNNGDQDQTGFTVSYKFSDQDLVEEIFTDVLEAGEEVDYVFATTIDIPEDSDVLYDLLINIDLEDDELLTNNSLITQYFIQETVGELPLGESFEEVGFPPTGWVAFNSSEIDSWEEVTTMGIQGEATTVGFVNNFEYRNSIGTEDILETVTFELSGEEKLLLNFDLAKAQRLVLVGDGLRVDMSLDCGETFTTIYEETGSDLSTIPSPVDVSWEPSSIEDWKTEEIDISDYKDETAMFRFVNIRGAGNSTYLDNIRIAEEVVLSTSSFENSELSRVSIYPNPASDLVNIALPNTINGRVEIEVTNSLGQVVERLESSNASDLISIDVSSFSKGLYFIGIDNQNKKTVQKIIVR